MPTYTLSQISDEKLLADLGALARMGFTRNEARAAVTRISEQHLTTFDQCIRAALGELTRSRCSESISIDRTSVKRLCDAVG